MVLLGLLVGCGSSTPDREPARTANTDPEEAERPALTPLAEELPAIGTTWSGSFAAVPIELPEARERDVVVEHGRPLIFVDPERFVEVSPGGETRTEPNPVGFQAQLASKHPIPSIRGVFLIAGRESFVAIDRRTFEPRWTAPRSERTAVWNLRSAGNAFVVSTALEMRSLDPSDGHELWTAEDIANGGFAEAGHGLVLIEDWDANAVIARDARTGQERFRVAATEPRVGLISEHGFGVTSSEGPAVIVGLDGEIQQRVDVEGRFDEQHLDMRSSVVVGADGATVAVRTGRHTLEVRRYAGGEVRARSAPMGTADRDPSLVLGSGGVWLRTSFYTVRALDENLHETWLGQPERGCPRPFVWNEREGAPSAVVCDRGGGAFYRATETRRERRSTTVSGTVRCEGEPLADAPLEVAGAMTRTDARGRYRIEVSFDEDAIYARVPYVVWQNDVEGCEDTNERVTPTGDAARADFDLGRTFAGALDGL